MTKTGYETSTYETTKTVPITKTGYSTITKPTETTKFSTGYSTSKATISTCKLYTTKEPSKSESLCPVTKPYTSTYTTVKDVCTTIKGYGKL